MADDEDVVFDNSPLYKHLSEVGFTDFDAESLNDIDEFAEVIAKGNPRQTSCENLSSRNAKEWAYWSLNSLKRVILGCFLPSAVSEEISCHLSCITMIKTSELLAENDIEILYRFEHCTDTKFETHSYQTVERNMEGKNSKFSETNDSTLSSLIASRFMIGVTLLTAIVLGLLLNTNSICNLQTLSYIFLLIISIWLPLQLYFSRIKDKIYRLKKDLALLSSYILLIGKLLVLFRKVILFIQEKELIARGHIIVNLAAPVTRLESQIKQCMMLRKCLFIEMDNYLKLLCQKMKDISHSRSFSWLQKELSTIENERIELETNEYSLKKLKKALATLGSHQSLLLCCITLNKMLAIIDLRQSGAEQDNSYEFNLGDLLDKGKRCFENVTQCYKFHKVDVPASIFDENQTSWHMQFEKTIYSSFTMALRSLTLHLQQACKTSIEVEETLEETISKSTKNPSSTGFEEINKQLLSIGDGIQKVSLCLEESQSRLEEIALSSAKDKKTKDIVEEKPDVNLIEREKRNIQILNLDEEAIEPVPDQIFEGETTSDRDNEEQFSTNLGREELLREENARQESRYFLKELKSVLATKDEEKMVGIPRVLLSKKHVAVEGDAESSVRSEEVRESCPVVASESEGVNKSCPVMDSYNSEKETREESSMDEMRSSKTYVENADLTVTNQAMNMMQVSIDPPKNLEQPLPGSDNSGTGIVEDGGNVYNPLRDRGGNDQSSVAQISHANPFASMVAAVATARNKQFGIVEQSYGETFYSDESDADI